VSNLLQVLRLMQVLQVLQVLQVPQGLLLLILLLQHRIFCVCSRCGWGMCQSSRQHMHKCSRQIQVPGKH